LRVLQQNLNKMDINSYISGITASITNQNQKYAITPAIVGNAFTDLAAIISVNASGVTENQITSALGFSPASASTTLAGYHITSSDTLFDSKYLPLTGVPNGVYNVAAVQPVYAANYSNDINATINTLYSGYTENIILSMLMIDSGNTLGNWVAYDTNSTVVYDTGGTNSLLYTRSSASTDAGYSGFKETLSGTTDLSMYDCFDFDLQIANYDNRLVSCVLKLTDINSTITYIRTFVPTRLYSQFVTVSFDKRLMGSYVGSQAFDWTQIKSIALTFEVKLTGWTCYMKNFRASAWYQLSNTLIDTYGFTTNDTTSNAGLYIDFGRGKIRGDVTGTYTSGSTYSVSYYYGGGTVVIPKGKTITNQVLLRSNLTLQGINKYEDILQLQSGVTYAVSGYTASGVTAAGHAATIVNKEIYNGCYNVHIFNLGVNNQQHLDTTQTYDGVNLITLDTNRVYNYYGFRNISLMNLYFNDVMRSTSLNTCYYLNACSMEGLQIKHIESESIFNNGIEFFNANGAIVDGYVHRSNDYRSSDNSQSAVVSFNGYSNKCMGTNITAYKAGAGLLIKNGSQNCTFRNFNIEVNNDGCYIVEEGVGGGTSTTMMGNRFVDGIIYGNVQPTGAALMALGANPIYTNTAFKNNTFENITCVGGWDGFYGGNPASAIIADNTVLKNCKFISQRANAIDWQNSYQTNFTIDGCLFYDCNINQTVGTGVKIINNTGIFPNTKTSFITVNGGGTVSLIANNYSVGLDTSIGLSVISGTVQTIFNNTFSGYTYGIQLAASVSGATIINNNLSGNITSGLNLNGATNNTIYGNIGFSDSIPASEGGTGINTFAVGDLLFASGTTALSRLAAVATGSTLVSNGTGTAPTWTNSPTISGTLTANVLKLGTGTTVSTSSTNTVTNKIPIVVSGVTYYVLASTSAT